MHFYKEILLHTVIFQSVFFLQSGHNLSKTVSKSEKFVFRDASVSHSDRKKRVCHQFQHLDNILAVSSPKWSSWIYKQ